MKLVRIDHGYKKTFYIYHRTDCSTFGIARTKLFHNINDLIKERKEGVVQWLPDKSRKGESVGC